MSENLFRIDGFYRQVNGRVVRLRLVPLWSDRDVMAQAVDARDEQVTMGARSLISGHYPYTVNEDYPGHLLPGELHNVNGEWVPIEDPELIALQTRPQHEPASVEDVPREKDGLVPQSGGKLAPEAPRPPLAYFSEAKRFDAFPGFTVTSDCAVESQPNGSFRGVRLDGCESYRAPKAL